MGSISVSSLIIFIASIVVATAVAGTLFTTIGDISSTAEQQGSNVESSINVDIDVLNDGEGSNFYTETAEGSEITYYIRNNGEALSHDPSSIDILLNGRFIDSDRITTAIATNGASTWDTDVVIEVTVTVDGELSGKNQLSTSVEGGDEELIEFVI